MIRTACWWLLLLPLLVDCSSSKKNRAKGAAPAPDETCQWQQGQVGLSQAVQKSAVLRFKELERMWLKDSPVFSDVGPSWAEVGFVLAGIKPCALFYLYKEPTYAARITSLLQTVVDQFGLEREGFQAHVISHKLLTNTPDHPGFEGAAVFVNHNHDDFRRVRKVFLTPHRGNISERLVGRALGYPTGAGDQMVYYMNKSECSDKSKHSDCVMLEYFLADWKEEDYPAIMKHFHAYRRAFARQLGQKLTINMRWCPGLASWWSENEVGTYD